MKRPGDQFNRYLYAGITGFAVLAAALVLYCMLDNLGTIGSWFSAINSALYPVYVGLIIAYLLSPLVNKADRYVFIPLMKKITKKDSEKVKGVARGFSVATVLILAILVIFCLIQIFLFMGSSVIWV